VSWQCYSDQACRDIWPGGKFNTDPRRLWDFLERIGAVGMGEKGAAAHLPPLSAAAIGFSTAQILM